MVEEKHTYKDRLLASFYITLQQSRPPLQTIMARSLRIFASALLVILGKALPAPDPIDYGSLECLSSLHAYDSAEASWSAVPVTQTVSSSPYIGELETDVPYTTLCDGRPRALEARYTTAYTTYDPPLTVTHPQGDWDPAGITDGVYTEPAPTCTVAKNACSALHSSYTSALSDWKTNDAPEPTSSPHCRLYTPCNEFPDYCFIYGNGAQLYYWPVTTTLGDFCAYNGSTIFAQPTNPPLPNTVVTDGHTFTSPTNYASFRNVQGIIHTTRHRRVECGTASYKNLLIPLTETFNSFGARHTPESFNFENLNTIPVSAYEAQRKCRNGRDCTTISGFYTPIIPLPTEVLNLEVKEWKDAGCKGLHGADDDYYMTPVALVTPAPTAKGKMVR